MEEVGEAKKIILTASDGNKRAMRDFFKQTLGSLPKRALPQANYQSAAVLMAITDEATPHVVLTQRTQHLSAHSGQVAFPGGKCDAADADVTATALRESHEEIGLSPADVSVVAVMGQVYSRHGFVVTPIVGVIDPQVIHDFCINPDEIEHIFCVPLQFFLDSKPTMHAASMAPHFYQVPSFKYGQFLIWGMTAFVLAEFFNHAYDARFPLQTPLS